MKERIAIVDGIRTPFCRAGGALKGQDAAGLAAYAMTEVMCRTGMDPFAVQEVVVGNCANPPDLSNIARVAALEASMPISISAYTVQRNCASGMEALTTASNKVLAGQAQTILVGATESMTNYPLLFKPQAAEWFMALAKVKTFFQKLGVFSRFKFSNMSPVVSLELGLTDPVCNLIMGKTTELIAREFNITREEQDRFSLDSHLKACAAQARGRFKIEILPVPVGRGMDKMQTEDEGPRSNQTMEALAKLKPYFDREMGSVTVANSCGITDGAAACLIMTESKAKAMGYKPLGYLREYSYAGLEGSRMGLGPVYATSRLLDRLGMTMRDFDVVEINEAFAAQVIANQRAFASERFAKEYLGKSEAIGEIDPNKLNVNGGAIALGHPVGASGLRLALTTLHELRHRGQQRGLATLCIGGGQGAALCVEVE